TDNGDTARQGSIEKPLEQPVAWPAEAQVDHLGIFVERELQRLRHGEAAAIGCRVVRRLPASAQSQEFRLGRDAGNTHAVIGTRRDDAGDRCPMRLGDIAATIDEVSTMCASEALAGASMTKQSTPSAGIGQPSMTLRPYCFASSSAICRRASRPALRS